MPAPAPAAGERDWTGERPRVRGSVVVPLGAAVVEDEVIGLIHLLVLEHLIQVEEVALHVLILDCCIQ